MRKSYFLFFVAAVFVMSCEDKIEVIEPGCPPDVQLGEKRHSANAVPIQFYRTGNKLIFKNQHGDSLEYQVSVFSENLDKKILDSSLCLSGFAEQMGYYQTIKTQFLIRDKFDFTIATISTTPFKKPLPRRSDDAIVILPWVLNTPEWTDLVKINNIELFVKHHSNPNPYWATTNSVNLVADTVIAGKRFTNVFHDKNTNLCYSLAQGVVGIRHLQQSWHLDRVIR